MDTKLQSNQIDIVGLQYARIKGYYKRVMAALQNKQPDLAKEILYEQMPASLYDMSLDVLYNYNKKFQDQSLRDLIIRVDQILNNEDDDISESDLEDPKTVLI